MWYPCYIISSLRKNKTGVVCSMCLEPTHIFANKEWECIIAQTCIQLVDLPPLAFSGNAATSHSSSLEKTPQLHKFVVKVNSVNLGYERVAMLAKESNGLLVLKANIPPSEAVCTFILFSLRSSSVDIFEHKLFFPTFRVKAELSVM